MNGADGHDHGHSHHQGQSTHLQSDAGQPSAGRLYVLAEADAHPFVKVLAVANETVWFRTFVGNPTVTTDNLRGRFSLQIHDEGASKIGPVEIQRASRREFLAWAPMPVYVEANLSDDEWQATVAERFAALGALTSEMAAQVEAIAASRAIGIERRPCTATLKDGTLVDRVIVVEVVEAAAAWMLPASDEGPYGRAIDIATVAALADSTERLPADMATRVYMAGETAKDQYEFVIVLTDGTEVGCITGAVVDFPGLPAGVKTADVASVRVIARAGFSGERGPTDFRYCYYRQERGV